MPDSVQALRPCPHCGQPMEVEKKEGVSIDVCRQHGIWLDLGELDVIVSKITARFANHHERAVRDAVRRGKKEGALWGWWSLMLPD